MWNPPGRWPHCLQHHERMNGSGYPRNLKGDEIIIEARIMAVADVVEAMASIGPNRPGLGMMRHWPKSKRIEVSCTTILS